MVFDGVAHQSVARRADLAERSVVVSSFGKSFHVTGWRVGYCLAPAALSEEIRKVATIPLSAFYGDGTDHGIIRLSFSKDEDTLREGARRLCAV